MFPWRPAILSPTRDLSLLGDIAANHHIDARRQLVAVFTGEDLYVNYDAVLAVRHPQRGVSHLSRLFAEDGAEQAFLGGELSLALGRYLADQDIAGTHLCADADNAALVQILERVLADVGDIAGDLLRARALVSRASVSYSSIWIEV